MEHLCHRFDCTGCMACVQSCGRGAISVNFIDGFAYPCVDESKCINCSLCDNVCPVINMKQVLGNKHTTTEACKAVWNNDENVRLQSSSGGVFSALAETIISLGGVVYGAAWNEEMILRHCRVDNVEKLEKLRRSKYVQSDIGDSYIQVKNDLKNNKKVLFCGTPCQVAGLRSFLGWQNYDDLYTVDVLCQGVPSPLLFDKYIKEQESKGWKVVDCNFRSKKRGWRCGLMMNLSLSKNVRTRHAVKCLNNSPYYNSFINEYLMRPSCYDCKFKTLSNGYYSDLTIADFWRIGNNIPLHADNYTHGISAVIENTEKGTELLNLCKNKITIVDRTWEEFQTNGGLRNSSKPRNNDEVYRYLCAHTWTQTGDKFFRLSKRTYLRNLLYLTFGEKFVRFINLKLKIRI